MTTTLIPSLLNKKLVMITGKGGIGKTLMSSALGQLSAATKRHPTRGVLLAESAAHDQLTPTFGLPAVGHLETKVAEGLTCINLSAAGNFREYITKYLGQKVLFDTVFNHRVVKSFFNTIPGLAEVMLLGRIFYSLELSEHKYDQVIFDGAASGHFHSLMTTPDAIISSGLAGPLVKETRRIRDYLADATKCALVIVATPEELVVAETLDFLPKLIKASPVQVAGVILNRMPPRVSGPGRGAAESYLEHRYLRAAKVRETLREGLRDLPMIEVPEFGFVDEPLPTDFYKFLSGVG